MHDGAASPYTVLGITTSATLPEVLKAYQQALRARAYPAQEVTQAFHALRDTRKRIEYDLFELFLPSDVSEVRQILENLPPLDVVPRDVDPLPIDVSPARFLDGMEELELTSPPPCPLRFAYTRRFTSYADVLPPLTFPT
jgi:curved DNA-binding protein CbpA